MKFRSILLASALTIGAVSTARAQDAQGFARARAALPPAAAASFEQTVRAAAAQGLPADALVAKALEGIAKGVPGERIVVAVRQLSAQLGRADAMLRVNGRAAAAADVTAVADALGRGVPESAVRSLRRDARANESLALSVHALADLLDDGVPVAIGLDVIGAWRGRGANPAQLTEIPATVERLVRQGVLPAQAGAAVAAGVRAGRGLGTLGPADAAGKVTGAVRGRGRSN